MSLVPFVHLDAPLVDARPGDELPLSTDEAHHLTTVLRLAPGAAVEVADGAGWTAPGELVTGRGVALRGAPTVRERPRPALEVVQALPKGRRFDEIVRTLTELDVDAIHPVRAERCVTVLNGPKATRSQQRWQAVARAACEQSRRAHLPRVAPVGDLAQVVEQAGEPDVVVLVAHPGASSPLVRREEMERCARVLLVIGPEGGLSDEELTALRTAGAETVGLGPTVLRTEHAAAAGLAAISCALGRWG